MGIYLYKPPLDEPMRSVAYFTSGSIDENTDLNEFGFSCLTHVIYAFAHIDGTTLDVYIENESGLKKLCEYLAVEYPDIKVMLSIASSWENDGMCEAAHTAENRANIVSQCNTILNKYGLSGFDIDWEYPTYAVTGAKTCKDCAKDHASLLEALRYGLPSGTVLSFGGAGNCALSSSLKNTRLRKVVDFVNVMLYDMGMDRHSSFGDSKKMLYYYQLLGYSKKQINMGMPYYGRCSNPQYDYLEYSEIMDLIKSDNAVLVQTNDYSHIVYDNSLISFDTREQIVKKTRYAKKRGYGGVFCWNLSCDLSNELTTAVWDILRA